MQAKPEIQKVFYYVNLVLTKRWFLIIPFCISMVVGLYFSIVMPEIYEASTLILVEPQRVPTDFVKSIVSLDIESRLSTIKQQILSRTNLEKIITQYNLFSEPEQENMFMEDKLESLRKRINVKVTKVRGGSDAFSISFKGQDPEAVMHITNTLSSYFINENLKIREAQAAGTSVFLEGELGVMRARLVEVENSLREYRSRYMGELPEQLQTNLSIITTLQKQLDEKRERMREEKRRLALLAAEIEEEKNYIDATTTVVGTEPGEAITIGQLKAQLTALRSSYTDRHPDVIRVKSKIAELEAASGISGSIGSDTSARGSNGDPNPTIASTALREKIRMLAEIKIDIDTIAKDIKKVNQQLGSYQQRVERTPIREEELISLNRDYKNIQDSYNSLLNRQLEAEIAVNMEKKQKGEQFRILDQARLPQKPISPDLRKFLLLSVAAGLGIGGGLIFLLDLLNTTLKDPKDYETQLGLTVLATIPRLDSPRDKILRYINRGLTAVSLVVAAALTTGFALLVVKGVEPTIAFVREFAKL